MHTACTPPNLPLKRPSAAVLCSHRYYEPLAAVAPLEEVLAGPPLRKLLFMTHPEAVEGHLKPHWSSALEGSEAEMMQAVPDMLGGLAWQSDAGRVGLAGLEVQQGAGAAERRACMHTIVASPALDSDGVAAGRGAAQLAVCCAAPALTPASSSPF